ncbi:translesion DNA synthesis-associated protein ImuA [Rhodoferax sediminis]|uniref:Translesion DNA synthesis-associated protein ImuA n=1 Tax=Rhodoferax sediminis TaxID=2509614 RepID=A0A515D9M1_9BURK|nr:translesion DNA synthesis-associated protein ImuA [Rhodoferax sediminis]QDL37111.1 translesion DNA synthesis-associated protein ImuA [Rhodoferax sediminis]
MAASLSLLSPATGPGDLSQVWRAAELGRVDGAVVPTGQALLDAQLPGGGWPVGAMVEVLQEQAGAHEWDLLLPALVRLAGAHSGPMVLVGSPYVPFSPALAARGLPGERLLCVDAAAPAARLWACEQALRCFDAAAVLAWLPQARASALRRLHMAAQDGGKLFFVFRPAAAQHESSAASLRLLLGGIDVMTVDIFKRRGPPLPAPLVLPARSPRLAALLAASHSRRLPIPTAAVLSFRTSHALDRVAAAG